MPMIKIYTMRVPSRSVQQEIARSLSKRIPNVLGDVTSHRVRTFFELLEKGREHVIFELFRRRRNIIARANTTVKKVLRENGLDLPVRSSLLSKKTAWVAGRRLVDRKRQGAGRIWSMKEIQRLRRLYPITKTEDLVELLGKGYEQIRRKAGALGLKKKKKGMKQRPWTKAEIAYLKKNYANARDRKRVRDLAKRMGRNIQGVYDMASKLGLSKPVIV